MRTYREVRFSVLCYMAKPSQSAELGRDEKKKTRTDMRCTKTVCVTGTYKDAQPPCVVSKPNFQNSRTRELAKRKFLSEVAFNDITNFSYRKKAMTFILEQKVLYWRVGS